MISDAAATVTAVKLFFFVRPSVILVYLNSVLSLSNRCKNPAYWMELNGITRLLIVWFSCVLRALLMSVAPLFSK